MSSRTTRLWHAFQRLLARAGRLIDRPRVLRWTVFVLVAEVIASVLLWLGTHGLLVHLDKPTTTDFVSFYAAGTISDARGPLRVYDRAFHWAAEQAATVHGIPYVFFFYPPAFLLLCGLLARLPYLAAFYFFEATTALGLLALLRTILGPRRPRSWLLPTVTYAPFLWSLGFGQNSSLTACLFAGGSLLFVSGRRFLAGFVLALLLYKPHFGLLLVPAMLAGGERRALAGLATGAAAVAAVTGLVFGFDSWLAFLRVITHASGEFATHKVCPFDLLVSVFGACRLLGIGSGFSTMLGWTAGGLIAGLTVFVWRATAVDHSKRALAARWAVLSSGTPLVMPIVLFYDQTLLLVAVAWLLRSLPGTRIPPALRSGLALLWIAGLLTYPLPRALHVPIGTITDLSLFGMALAASFAVIRSTRLRTGARPTSELVHAAVAGCLAA